MKDIELSKNIVPKSKKIIEKNGLVRRINVIEGQVHGIKQLIVNEASWEKTLIQISAVINSLRSIGNAMTEKYICEKIHKDLDDTEKEKLMTIINLIEKFNR